MTGVATASRLARRLGGEICPVALDVLLVEADENTSFQGKSFHHVIVSSRADPRESG